MSKDQDKKQNSNTIIRVEKNKNNPYVMLNKGFLDEQGLSWKAKGLLSYLLSKPDNWKVRISQLISASQDEEKAVRSALRELQNNKYLQRYPVYENGKVIEWETVIYETPCDQNVIKSKILHPDGSENISYYSAEELKKKYKKAQNTRDSQSMEEETIELVNENLLGENLLGQNGKVGLNDKNDLLAENVQVGFVQVENLHGEKLEQQNLQVENHTLLNNDIRLSNKLELKNQSTNPSSEENLSEMEGRLKDIIKSVDKELLINEDVEPELVESMVQAISLMYISNKSLKINGDPVPVSLVRKTLSKLDTYKLLYVAQQYDKVCREQEIKVPLNYLKTMIFNSVSTEPLASKAAVNYKVFGEGSARS